LVLMILWILRGISRVTAAATGLLLVYGTTYAMEGMTTRIPMRSLHELAITTLWMLPWMLLFCSGVEDFGRVARKAWIFWVGVTLASGFVYYLERHTTSSVITKAAMPLLVTVGGLLPHVIRRINFVFTVFSFAAGIAGLVILYLALPTLVSASSSFANKESGFVIVGFGIASVATGVLSVVSLRRRNA